MASVFKPTEVFWGGDGSLVDVIC